MVSEIAEKWTNLAKTGTIGVTFMGFDLTTVMFTLQNAQDTLEVSSIPSNYLHSTLILIACTLSKLNEKCSKNFINATRYNDHEHFLTHILWLT